MVFRHTGFGGKSHLDRLRLSPCNVIPGDLSTTVGSGFEETFAPIEHEVIDARFFLHLSQRRLQGFLALLLEAFRKIPVMKCAQQQCHPALPCLSRDYDATGEPVFRHVAHRSTSTGAELMAPRAAKKPLMQTRKTPAVKPATHSSGLNS